MDESRRRHSRQGSNYEFKSMIIFGGTGFLGGVIVCSIIVLFNSLRTQTEHPPLVKVQNESIVWHSYHEDVFRMTDGLTACVNLNTGEFNSTSPHIALIHQPRRLDNGSCSNMAVVQINFTDTNYSKVRFDMYFNKLARGHVFTVSDNHGSNGFGGVGADVQAVDTGLYVYLSSSPEQERARYVVPGENLLHQAIGNFIQPYGKVSITVERSKVTWDNHVGTKGTAVIHRHYLFDGLTNEGDRSIYLGMNRVVCCTHRVGTGLCWVGITMLMK